MLDEECVRLNEVTPRFYVISHENIEHVVGVQPGLNPDLQKDACLGIHGGLPELVGVHFAQTFVSFNINNNSNQSLSIVYLPQSEILPLISYSSPEIIHVIRVLLMKLFMYYVSDDAQQKMRNEGGLRATADGLQRQKTQSL